MGRGNQYIQLFEVCTVNCWPLVRKLPTFPHRVCTSDLRGGRWVSYHLTTVGPYFFFRFCSKLTQFSRTSTVHTYIICIFNFINSFLLSLDLHFYFMNILISKQSLHLLTCLVDNEGSTLLMSSISSMLFWWQIVFPGYFFLFSTCQSLFSRR